MYEPNYSISDELLVKIAKIEAVRQQVDSSMILPDREIEMRYRATVEATHSSTSIEGNPLNLKQVEKVLSEKTQKLARHQYAEMEVRNYKKALDYIDKRKANAKGITEEDILKIHGIVTDKLIDDERKIGAWRWNPVYIENEKGENVYKAAPANSVPLEVRHLLDWLDEKGKNTHPVVSAAIFHFQFVSIHPFVDGNGRTTRLLTALHLGLCNYDFRGSLVLDTYYAINKNEYYDALSIADNYKARKHASLNPWINYFADGFLVSANVMAAEVKILSSIASNMTLPQKISRDEADILSYIKQFGSITISEAEDILPDITRRTIQRKLNSLEKKGYIKSEGATTNLKYISESERETPSASALG